MHVIAVQGCQAYASGREVALLGKGHSREACVAACQESLLREAAGPTLSWEQRLHLGEHLQPSHLVVETRALQR